MPWRVPGANALPLPAVLMCLRGGPGLRLLAASSRGLAYFQPAPRQRAWVLSATSTAKSEAKLVDQIPMLAPVLLLTVIASAYDVQDKVARINAYDMPCTQPVGVRRAQLNGHRRARWLLCASRVPTYVPALARLHARMRRMPEQGSYEHVDCGYAEYDSSVSPRLPILKVPVQPPLPTPIGVRPRPAGSSARPNPPKLARTLFKYLSLAWPPPETCPR